MKFSISKTRFVFSILGEWKTPTVSLSFQTLGRVTTYSEGMIEMFLVWKCYKRLSLLFFVFSSKKYEITAKVMTFWIFIFMSSRTLFPRIYQVLLRIGWRKLFSDYHNMSALYIRSLFCVLFSHSKSWFKNAVTLREHSYSNLCWSKPRLFFFEQIVPWFKLAWIERQRSPAASKFPLYLSPGKTRKKEKVKLNNFIITIELYICTALTT